MIKAIIFDFDGVILNSANIKTEAFRELFAGYPDKVGEIVRYHVLNGGISRYVKFRHIYEEILKKKFSKENEVELGRRFSEIALKKVLHASFVPGAKQFLDKNKGLFSFFIASGTPEKELKKIVQKRHLQDYFKELHGSPAKKEDIIADIMERHSLTRDEVVYVGDAESDRIAAEKANVKFIHLINDLTGLDEILKKADKKREAFRILLVYANKMMENLIPINISSLSAVLKKAGFDVRLFDTTYYNTEKKTTAEVRVENLQLRSFDLSKYGIRYKETDVYQDFRNVVREYKPGIIGLSAVEDTYNLGISLLRKIKDLRIPTIAGGVHTVISPEEVIKEDSVDMVCTGEGEDSFVNLCEKIKSGKNYTDTRGIWFKKDGRIIKNPPEKLADINKLPFLDFTVYEKERFYRPMQGKVYRMLPVEISRGCPFACTYCAAPRLKEIYKPLGSYYRKKKIKNVINEIKFYQDRYGLNYVYFTSETFLFLSDAEFNEFVSLYKEIKLPFWFQTRPETITEKRIKMLEGINCDRMTVGIESGNEEIRKNILNRKISNNSIIKAFEILKKSSIPVSVNNIIGIPDETRKEVFDTINLNRAVKADSISVFIFTPYRGTRLRQRCLDKGYILPEAYSGDHTKRSILNMPSMSQEEIRGLLRTFPLYTRFEKEFYPSIQKAEKLDEEGNKEFKRLSKIFSERFFQ